MTTAYNSIAQQCASFLTGSSVMEGEPCKMTTDRTVNQCASGNDFMGVVLHIRNKLATVAVSGFVTVPYTGSAPLVGRVILVGNGSHGVMVGESGTARVVVSRDLVNKTVTFLM